MLKDVLIHCGYRKKEWLTWMRKNRPQMILKVKPVHDNIKINIIIIVFILKDVLYILFFISKEHIMKLDEKE